jgi:hypothetical protein
VGRFPSRGSTATLEPAFAHTHSSADVASIGVGGPQALTLSMLLPASVKTDGALIAPLSRAVRLSPPPSLVSKRLTEVI